MQFLEQDIQEKQMIDMVYSSSQDEKLTTSSNKSDDDTSEELNDTLTLQDITKK